MSESSQSVRYVSNTCMQFPGEMCSNLIASRQSVWERGAAGSASGRFLSDRVCDLYHLQPPTRHCTVSGIPRSVVRLLVDDVNDLTCLIVCYM